MKKIILIFVLCFSVAGAAYAQNNTEAMRYLMVGAMMQYGQKLYDRGDFNEATAVFNHVLTFDGAQAQALEYLKDMGHAPVVSAGILLPPQRSRNIVLDLKDRGHAPVWDPVTILPAEKSEKIVIKQNVIVIRRSQGLNIDPVDVTDTESMKKAIEAQKLIVEKLRFQVQQMRAKLASDNTGE